jgi:hypothetical protein
VKPGWTRGWGRGPTAVARAQNPARTANPFVGRPLPWLPGPSSPAFPGGCAVPLWAASEAYEYLVIGLANPFALRWVPVNTLIDGVPVGEIFALGRTTPIPNAASVIHPGDGGHLPAGDGYVWHHISIGIDGEAIFPANAVPPNPERFADNNGNQSTLLKARIKLSMGNSRTRQFDIDIGAGVEIDVLARSVVSIEALVPDPTSIPAAVPAELAPPGFTFAVALVATVTCGACCRDKMPATYSQPFFFGLRTETAAVMPIVRDAREIELFAGALSVVAGTPSVQGIFAYVLSSPVEPSFVLPTTFVNMGEIVSGPGFTQTPRQIIPGNANAIIVSSGTSGGLVNVVQILNT